MTRITFIEHNGTAHEVDANDGESIMQAALDNLIPGVIGDCGGCCTCATCHCFVDEAFVQGLPPVSVDEQSILDGLLDTQPNSRLSCQLKVGPELDGLTIRLPESQF